MLAVLRRRNVALLALGHLISVVGSWILLIALPFYVYQRTGSALAAGSMFLLEMVPALLFGSVAGVFADRWDRRKTMIVADVLRAALLLPLLLATQDGWLWVVFPVAFLEATVTQFFLPARGALLPRLVPDEELEGANAAISVGEEFAMLAGSVFGGALIGLLGIGGLALLDATTYLLSAVAITLIAIPTLVPGADQPETPSVTDAEATPSATPLRAAFFGVWTELVEGLRLVRGNHAVMALFAVIALAMIGEGILAVLSIAYVEGVLGYGAKEFSWIFAGRALGGLVSGLVLVGLAAKHLSPGKVIAIAGIVDGLAVLAMFQVQVLPAMIVLFAIAGLAVVPFYATQQSLLQRLVPDEFRGRVFGAWGTTQALVMLGMAGLAGALAEPVGIMPLITVGCVAFVAAGLVAFVTLARSERRAAPDVAVSTGRLVALGAD